MNKKKAIKKPFYCGGGYGWMGMSPSTMHRTMKAATVRLGRHIELLKPDALAYTGSSGAALAFIAAVFFKLPVLYVRKENESSHGSMVDGNATGPIHSYLIIDDFIDSGATVERIVQRITQAAGRNNNQVPECLGIFLYAPSNGQKRYAIGDQVYDILS